MNLWLEEIKRDNSDNFKEDMLPSLYFINSAQETLIDCESRMFC